MNPQDRPLTEQQIGRIIRPPVRTKRSVLGPVLLGALLIGIAAASVVAYEREMQPHEWGGKWNEMQWR